MRSPRSSSQRGFDTPTGPRRGSPAAILVRDRVSQARTRERPDRLRRRHFGPGTVTTRAGRRVPTDDRAGRARRPGGLCSRAWPPRCTSSSSRRPPMRAASPFTSTPGSGARDSTPLRVSPRARVHRRTDKGPLCSAARARECPARGGDRAVALVLPKTCPQACAHHSGDTRFHSFAGSFDCPGRGHLVEPLRFREVLDRTRSEGALQGLPTRGRPFPGRALLSSEVRRNPQNGLFCRYLSPLPDSNRRPPPYHGGFAPLLCDLGNARGTRFSLQFDSFLCLSHLSLEGP
jgi:hypothetical protein